MQKDTLMQLSLDEAENVSGGVIPVAVAFVAGAKWGAGIVLGAAALVGAMK